MAKDSEPTVRVYVVNEHRTSQGVGPGIFELPADEASAVIGRRYGRPLCFLRRLTAGNVLLLSPCQVIVFVHAASLPYRSRIVALQHGPI